MTNKCSQCGKFIAAVDGAKCSRCGCMSHRACGGYVADSRGSAKWICKNCKNKPFPPGPEKAASTSNLLAGQPEKEPDMETPFYNVEFEDGRNTDSLTAQIKLLRSEFMSMCREIKADIASIRSSMSAFNSRVDLVEMRMSKLEEQLLSGNRVDGQESPALEVISQLKMELNEKEQDSLLNDLEIAGIPEQNGENASHLVNIIVKKLGISLETNEIVFAQRFGPRKTVGIGSGSSELPRPRNIVARIVNRGRRDDIIKAARVRRQVDTSGVVDGDPRRFYVNERLTTINRQLFNKARNLAKQHGWRYTWTRGGRIYVRKDIGGPVHRIRSEKDLHTNFLVNPVCS